MGKEGGNVGPELGSVASKYPRDELIASVLTPSAKISSGYEPERRWPSPTAASSPGSSATRPRTPSRSRTPTPSSSRSPRTTSTRASAATSRSCPPAWPQGLSPKDFADLIAYLETLKNAEVNKK